MQLRDYQHTLRSDIRAAFVAGHRCVLAVSPTGSGKTTTFADIATRTVQAGRRVGIMAHRGELCAQISRALGDMPHGLIRSGYPPNPYLPLQVASVQTLVNRTHRYGFDLLIVDEAHHAISASYQRIIAAYPAAHVIGFTATPCRLDGRGLGEAGYTALVNGPTVQWLTDAGYLAPALVYSLGNVDTTGVKKVGGDYNKTELLAATRRATIHGNYIEHYRKLCHKLPSIAFCISVEHAEEVAARFTEAGYRAASIDGKMKDRQRAGLINGLANGDLDVLTSCDLISEGVDVPVVVGMIGLRKTESEALHRQHIGRCLRTAPGKTHAIILDHVGNAVRHGLPEAPREWSLDSTARKPRDADPDIVSIRVCERCFITHAAAPVCPYCGFEYPVRERQIDEVAGELTLLEAAWAAAKPVNPAARMEEWQCKTLEDWQRLGQARGYKPNWAWYRWNARKGKAV